MTKKKTETKKGNSRLIILLVIFIAGIVFFPGFMLMVFIGFIPTWAAMLSDKTSNYALSFCVGVCNLAATLPCIIKLFNDQFSMIAVHQAIHDPMILLVILCGAGSGWVVYLSVPAITVNYYRNYDNSHLQKLLNRYKTIREHWGDAIPESEMIVNLINSSQEPPKS